MTRWLVTLTLLAAGCADPGERAAVAVDVAPVVSATRLEDALKALGEREGLFFTHVNSVAADLPVEPGELAAGRPWREAVDEAAARRGLVVFGSDPDYPLYLVEPLDGRVHLDRCPTSAAFALVARYAFAWPSPLADIRLLDERLPEVELSLDAERVSPCQLVDELAAALEAEVFVWYSGPTSGDALVVLPRGAVAGTVTAPGARTIPIQVGPPVARWTPAQGSVLDGRLEGVDGRGLVLDMWDQPRRLPATLEAVEALRGGRGRLTVRFGPGDQVTDVLVAAPVEPRPRGALWDPSRPWRRIERNREAAPDERRWRLGRPRGD